MVHRVVGVGDHAVVGMGVTRHVARRVVRARCDVAERISRACPAVAAVVGKRSHFSARVSHGLHVARRVVGIGCSGSRGGVIASHHASICQAKS